MPTAVPELIDIETLQDGSATRYATSAVWWPTSASLI
jgi:hypothetical protein